MFGRDGNTDPTCGFAFCLPPPVDANYTGEYGIMAFLFVWCTGWNFGCSMFVFAALARLRQQPSGAAACQLVISLVIPHVAIGLVIPYFMGGIIWEIIAIWPYYYRTYQLITMKVDSSPPSSPPTPPDPPSYRGSGESAASAVSVIVRMHTPENLRRGFSNPVVLAQAVPATPGSAVPAGEDRNPRVVLAKAVAVDGPTRKEEVSSNRDGVDEEGNDVV